MPDSGGRPRKHSLTLQGHRTSVSLEDAFWAGLREMASLRGLSVNALAAEIDRGRNDVGLASALRVAVLAHFRGRGDAGAGPGGAAVPDPLPR
jgi:predicted DNA-binding ribbon-helix-helix protein